MKISSLGMALGCAMALAAGSAFANVTPNLQDGSGRAVKDGSGACVVTQGQVLPECAGTKAAPAAPAAPAEPAKPATPAPATPSTPAKPAPSSVRQSVVIQADALFDFDKSVVRPDGKKAIDEALDKLNGVGLPGTLRCIRATTRGGLCCLVIGRLCMMRRAVFGASLGASL